MYIYVYIYVCFDYAAIVDVDVCIRSADIVYLNVIFMYVLAVLLLLRHRWYAAVILYSFAVSVKMNVILFLPGLAVILIRRYIHTYLLTKAQAQAHAHA